MKEENPTSSSSFSSPTCSSSSLTRYRLERLWDAAQYYVMLCPPLSRCYLRQMRMLARNSGQVLHPTINSQFCTQCSSLFVTGVNCKAKLLPLKRGHSMLKSVSKTSQKPHLMEFSCDVCQTTSTKRALTLADHFSRKEAMTSLRAKEKEAIRKKKIKLKSLSKADKINSDLKFSFRAAKAGKSEKQGIANPALVEAKQKLARKRRRKKGSSLQDRVAAAFGKKKDEDSGGGDLYNLLNMFSN
mmetsp:Transcript_28435/g.39681  ORF Transcript_28435/g.39681 Transcript_28435/m.39681 type:complete len:243 (+) Transcript_28435:63-791(+)